MATASMTGEQLVEYGCYWISRHRPAFKTLMHLVHTEVDNGNPNVQRGDIFNLARAKGLSVSEIKGLRRDNNLWPIITRYMVMLRPKLARALNFRKSKADDVDMEAMWHRHVSPSTMFLVRNWREAKAAVETGCVSAS